MLKSLGTFGRNSKRRANRFPLQNLQPHFHLRKEWVLEDEVFIGHNVTFINDLYPRSTNEGGQLQTESDWRLRFHA